MHTSTRNQLFSEFSRTSAALLQWNILNESKSIEIENENENVNKTKSDVIYAFNANVVVYESNTWPPENNNRTSRRRISHQQIELKIT